MTKRRKLVHLETYKYRAPDRRGLNGESKIVKIEEKWLKEQIYPQTLEEFLNEYTYDDAEYLYTEYTRA